MHARSRLSLSAASLVAILVIGAVYAAYTQLARSSQPDLTNASQISVKAGPPSQQQVSLAPLSLTINLVGQRKEADGSHTEVVIREGSVLRSGDQFHLQVEVNRPCHLYVLLFDSHGEDRKLVLIRNTYKANGGAPPFFQVDNGTSYEKFHTPTGPASLTVGEYNGDGLLDFFYMRNSADEFGDTNFMAAMYINTGTSSEPEFEQHDTAPSLDFTARFQAAHIYINWAADHLCSVDIDKDGDMDVLVISQDKIFLLRNPGRAQFQKSRFSLAELRYNQRTGYSSGRGGSAIAAGDFNQDGYLAAASGPQGSPDNMAVWFIPVIGAPVKQMSYAGPYGENLSPDGRNVVYLYYQHEPIDVHVVAQDGKDTMYNSYSSKSYVNLQFLGWAP